MGPALDPPFSLYSRASSYLGPSRPCHEIRQGPWTKVLYAYQKVTCP